MIKNSRIFIPWPCLYETFGTIMVDRKRRESILYFEKIVKKLGVNFIIDKKYRDNALNTVLENALNYKDPYSLVDCVIREILKDQLLIHYFVTNNEHDFSDICSERKIEIISLQDYK